MKAVAWTTVGGWANCDAASTFVLKVPSPNTGIVKMTVQLPARLIKGWVANGGAANHGLLLKADAGNLKLRFSQYAAVPSQRPALELFYK